MSADADYDDYYDAAKKDGEPVIYGKNGGCIYCDEQQATHTPGPWVYGEDVGTHVIRGAPEKKKSGDMEYEFRAYVASIWGGPHEANARLIASAPELLEALEVIASIAPGEGDVCELIARRARAAIAKATGAAS